VAISVTEYSDSATERGCNQSSCRSPVQLESSQARRSPFSLSRTRASSGQGQVVRALSGRITDSKSFDFLGLALGRKAKKVGFLGLAAFLALRPRKSECTTFRALSCEEVPTMWDIFCPTVRPTRTSCPTASTAPVSAGSRFRHGPTNNVEANAAQSHSSFGTVISNCR
jgi:hypothetical protein